MDSAAQTQDRFSATNRSAGAAASGVMTAPSMASDPFNTKTKKQLFMSQRAERLKDPKVHKMGIDREALDAQVREKQSLLRLEKDRDEFFDRQALLMDRHACALQQEVNSIRAAREKELQDYRQTFQKKELAREWDLNDPEARRKELPARVGDSDPRNGPSSMQRFEGEDLDFAARKAAQQRQQHDWASQQVNEKLAKKWMEQERDRAFDDRNEEVNYRLYEVERKVADQRRLMEKNAADFNRALAEQQRHEAVRAKEEDTRLGLEEMAYQMDSDFLNERETVVGELGATVKAERYKGMSAKQKELLRAGQDEQLRELRRRRLMEVEEKKQWSQQEHMQLRMANALDRQQERERRAERERLAETHKMQAAAASQREAELDELYTNQVDEDYFKHWDRCL